MMKIEIKTGGTAFCDPYTGEENIECESRETARLLKKLANDIEHSTAMSGSLNDINGNKVLTWNRN